MRTRSTLANGPTVLFVSLFLFAGLSGPATAAAEGETAAPAARAGKARGGKKKVVKKQKALINMVERVAFPHEEVQTHALVTVPKQPPAPVGLKKTSARSRGPARVIDAQPGVAFDPTPAPTPPPAPAPVVAAPARPSGPEPTSRPHDVAPETRNEIDALLGKAFVKPGVAAAAAPEPSLAAAGSGSPNTDEIAAIMKPLRSEVKAACPFGQRGTVTVRIEVAGDGHVANATPEGPLAEQPGAACVLDAVRRTKFPASAGSTFRYPFQVK